VHRVDRFKKIAVIKEYILDEKDESNSPYNMHDNLDGSLQ
jgi:hypothetical protein